MGGPNSVHVQRVTKKGTVVWVCTVAVTWILALIIGESIPCASRALSGPDSAVFNDLLSLMASLFDSFFLSLRNATGLTDPAQGFICRSRGRCCH